MIYKPKDKVIELDRQLNEIDKFVIDFVSLLDKKYVIVSGYVSIVLGRSRATEDIDMLIPKMTIEEFTILWNKIHDKDFECLNTDSSIEAYNMLSNHAIRFSKINEPIPNMEFKLIQDQVQNYSYINRLLLIIKDSNIYISPLEMQIAYKLSLGSPKDFEDAKHILSLFNEKIDKDELHQLIDKLHVKDKFKEIDNES